MVQPVSHDHTVLVLVIHLLHNILQKLCERLREIPLICWHNTEAERERVQIHIDIFRVQQNTALRHQIIFKPRLHRCDVHEEAAYLLRPYIALFYHPLKRLL